VRSSRHGRIPLLAGGAQGVATPAGIYLRYRHLLTLILRHQPAWPDWYVETSTFMKLHGG